MPFDSAGNFTRSYNWQADRDAGIKIEAARMDGEFDNFAAGMNEILLRNGSAPITGNLNLNGNGIINLGQGTTGNPSVSFAADGTTGIYSPGTGQVAILSGGTQMLGVTSTGVTIPTLSATSITATTENINGPAGTNRQLFYQTAGLDRWSVYAGPIAESGANAGSNFYIARYDDTGTIIDSPLMITRSTGLMTLIDGLSVSLGGLTVGSSSSSTSGQITLTSPGSSWRGLNMLTNSVERWLLAADGAAETGSDVGTNFVINRYHDNGVLADQSLTIQRNNGLVGIPNSLSVGGSITAAGNFTVNGSVTTGAITANGLVNATAGLQVENHLTVSNGISGTGGITFDAITAGSSLTSNGTTTVGVLNGTTLNATGNIRTSSGQLICSGAAGTARYITISTGTLARWTIYGDATAESGSNVGTDFYIARWNDGGALIDNPFSIVRASGLTNINNLNVVTAATVPTPAKGDSSSSAASTSYVIQAGIQSAGQNVAGSGVLNLTRAVAGQNILVGSTVTSIHFPVSGTNTAADLTGTYCLSAYQGNTAPIPMTFGSGSDWKGQLNPGEKVILSGDGGGFFRVVAQGWQGGAPCLPGGGQGFSAASNGFQISPAGIIDQWGSTGSVAAGSLVNTAVTFPVPFPNGPFNISITAAGAAGTGGMAYPYFTNATKTGFTMVTSGAAACAYQWRAVGN